MTREHLTGHDMIQAERYRQRFEEGYTPQHDDLHFEGDLLRAAKAYIAVVESPDRTEDIGHVIWPWDRNSFKPSDDPIRTLTKAGALIAAEIDRRLRVKWDLESKMR